MKNFKIQLVDRNEEMVAEWKKAFGGCKDVEVHQGDLFAVKTDCLISPSNSFGFMDGGLDMEISKKIGWQVEKKVQHKIMKEFNGELLVGQALIVDTEYTEIPYVISAPTMRVPMILNESVNVYLATKAVFCLLKSRVLGDFQIIPPSKTNGCGTGKSIRAMSLMEANKINSITISGMGTGVGEMPYKYCAIQMRKAYDNFWVRENIFPESWSDAQEQHQLLYGDSVRDLQFKILK